MLYAGFTHMEDCTRQVCDQIIVKDEIDDSIATLTNLDLTLAALRVELEALRHKPPPTPSSSTLPTTADTVVTPGAVETTANGESSSASQTLPPWFQDPQPDAHNTRKRFRSTTDPSPEARDESNGVDAHVSKRLKPTSPPPLPSLPPSQSLPTKIAPLPAKAQDYSALLKDLDVKKARRLITARENAIKSVKTLVVKEKEKQREGVDTGGGVMRNGDGGAQVNSSGKE